MIICTTASLSKLPQALELARSVKAYHPEAKFVLGLIEEWVPESTAQSPWFDEVIQIKDIGIPHFRTFMFKLSATQAHDAVVGHLIVYLTSYDPHADSVIFLEHTMRLYGPLREVIDALTGHSIVLTPHLSGPNLAVSLEQEIKLHQTGSFNDGFIGVRRSKESKSFLTWWADKLYRDSYEFHDRSQQWLDLVPVLFHPFIIRQPGIHMACWNLHEPSRQITTVEADWASIVGGPMRCFNYRDEHNEFEESLYRLAPLQAEQARKLLQQYQVACQGHEAQGFNRETVWSYDYYYNGERISEEARNIYRVNEDRHVLGDPYAWSNKHIIDGIEGQNPAPIS
ncbi:hypothetical protein H8B09_02790 [Paenibacillus sp. PR3]|uniref:Uncharacterized protein n=1 Tax=Paenibacillus terricola TaxID=2763503 RepID=A0ABR8MPX5_9BACL|nr:hypothetical protein [Paenibacillus terricola]MBD3917665.1 hypothetical protein [Paenibacillus terricola]